MVLVVHQVIVDQVSVAIVVLQAGVVLQVFQDILVHPD